MKLVFSSAPIVPRLVCVRRSRDRFDITTGFHATDRLHVVRPCQGFDAGTILPVLGYCLWLDERGDTYAVHVYVSGYGTTAAGREAERFPAMHQQEVLFVALPPFITELDVTECADCLALERLHEAVIIPMYPDEVHRRLAS
jgi:hypothetical protein